MINLIVVLSGLIISPLVFVLMTLIVPLWTYTEYWNEYREERRNGNLTKSRQQLFDRYKNMDITLPNVGMMKTYRKDYFFLAYLELLSIATIILVLNSLIGQSSPNFSKTFLYAGIWLVYFEFYSFRRILLYREYKKYPPNSSNNEQEKPNFSYKNTGQESKQNSYKDDEFSYKKEKFEDDGREADSRFSTPRHKAKYKSMMKGANDPNANASEAGKMHTFIIQADQGKIKGIKPWKCKK